jgi:CheY-like chemotaxis protein
MGTASEPTAPTVLMVEDHDDTACLLRFLLEREGYTVRHVPDGWNARRLTETSAPPDLVLLDVALPSLSGLELLRIIRTTPEWQWIPVILVTADTRSETMSEATNLGATAYMQKPISPKRLMESLHRFLPRSNAQNGLTSATDDTNSALGDLRQQGSS